MLVRFIIRNIAYIFIIGQIWKVSMAAWNEYPKIEKHKNSESMFVCFAWQLFNFTWFFFEYIIEFNDGAIVLVPIVKSVLCALPIIVRYNLPDVAIVTAITTVALADSSSWKKYHIPRYIWTALVLLSHTAITLTMLSLMEWAFQHS